MALGNWKLEELEVFADSLDRAARKIRDTCANMRKVQMQSLVLQASTATSTYGPSIFALAGSIESEFEDQYNAAKLGRIPRWQQNQRKVEARAERKRLKEVEAAKRREGIKSADAASTEVTSSGNSGTSRDSLP